MPIARTLFRAALAVALLPAALVAQAQTAGGPAVPATAAATAATPPAAPARPTGVATLRAAELAGEIKLDGRFDEPAWATADSADAFTQSYPRIGSAPTYRTVVRVLYGPTALYVAVRAYDPHPDSIAAPLARRDQLGLYSDWIHVIVDSYHDRRTAWRFTVNPAGVKKDAAHSNNVVEDAAWDAVWQVATGIDSAGWTAEYRIPYSQIRFSGHEAPGGRVWGFQVMRDVARYQERDSFSPWSQRSPGFVSEFGDLVGLERLRSPQRLEIQPYASSKLTRAPNDAGNPFYRASDPAASAGVDVKYGLPLGMTLTATVNPDFGQVEVDPAVVNLTAFETFFEEKRPFFVEGADVFRFGQVQTINSGFGREQFFYSRRVGRQPQRAVFGADVAHVDAPGETTILGAAKVSGKNGPWTAGFMNALTAEESARYSTPDGTVRNTPVEPLTNYFVGRLRRDFHGGNTVIGAMGTAANRSLSDSVFTPLLRSSAYFGGVDFEHAWAQRAWMLSGYVGGSGVAGSPAAMIATQRSSARYFQRPDADYLRVDSSATSLGGHIAEVAVRHTGAWNMSVDLKQASPGFEINDLGFEARGDYRSLSTGVAYRRDRPAKLLRSWDAYLATDNAWNFGGNSIDQAIAVGGDLTLNSLWSASGQFQLGPAHLSDRLTRGGPLAASPRNWFSSFTVSQDPRKRITGALTLQASGDASGAWERTGVLSAKLRPSSSLRLSMGLTLDALRSTAQFVGSVRDTLATSTFGRRYVFADLHQTTVALESRLDWTFTPTLSLQLYAQPFVAAGDYSRLKEFLQPRTFRFGVYGDGQGTAVHDAEQGLYTLDPDGEGPAKSFAIPDPDFNFRSLRGNAVLRWEYRPGSALYLVWQQQRTGVEPFGTFDFSRDAGAVFREPATNVFLIKVTYWLGR